MRRYEQRDVTVSREVEVEYSCDRCGVLEADAGYGSLIPVAIEVNAGEEQGSRDEYDYCDDCLIALADVLRAAGSRSPLVQEPQEDWVCKSCGVDMLPHLSGCATLTGATS